MVRWTACGLAAALLALGLATAHAAAPAKAAPPQPVRAADPNVDISLVMALDASGSIDDSRFEIQKQGYAAAFRNPRVLSAIQGGAIGAIAVSMVQWTGPDMQVIVVPWMQIKDQKSALAVAAAITASRRQLFGGGTSISGGIDTSVTMLTASPYRATHRVIDISGDGANNRGRDPIDARNDAVKLGIRINGLPILVLEPELDVYYKQNVIGGPGAFMIPVKNYDVFAAAILRKLVTEISENDHDAPKLASLAAPKSFGRNLRK